MQKVAQKILDSVNEDWQRAQFAPSYFLPSGGTAEFLDHSTSVRRRPTIAAKERDGSRRNMITTTTRGMGVDEI